MEKKPRVVNCNNEFYDIYIGRGRGSIWGNKFRIGIDGNRKEVIKKHKNWFLYSKEAKELRERIHELRGKILGCHCAPLKCHGDLYVEIANK